MFEEEQRLRRGLELSEMQKLDKLLGLPCFDFIHSEFIVCCCSWFHSGPVASASRQRPKSAYAAPPGPHQVAAGGAVGHQQVVQLAHGGNLPLSLPQPPQQNPTSSISSESSDKPVIIFSPMKSLLSSFIKLMINLSVKISECKKKLKNTKGVKPKILADRRVHLYPNWRHLEVKNSPEDLTRCYAENGPSTWTCPVPYFRCAKYPCSSKKLFCAKTAKIEKIQFKAEAAARAKKKQHRQSCPPRAAQVVS